MQGTITQTTTITINKRLFDDVFCCTHAIVFVLTGPPHNPGRVTLYDNGNTLQNGMTTPEQSDEINRVRRLFCRGIDRVPTAEEYALDGIDKFAEKLYKAAGLDYGPFHGYPDLGLAVLKIAELLHETDRAAYMISTPADIPQNAWTKES